MTESVRIIVCVLLPVVAAIMAYGLPKLRSIIVVTTTLVVAGLVLSLYSASFSGHVTHTLFQGATGLRMVVQLDPLTWLFAFVSSMLWVPASIYALGYMGNEGHAGRFFAFYLLSLAATLGIAFAGSLVTLYFFYELLTLVTFPLVVYSGGREAAKAGRTYIIYSLSGAALVLLAIALTSVLLTSTSTFIPGGMLLVGAARVQLARVILLLFVFGFGMKAAIVPMHRWLPLAMAAPTPVSALLHAVAVVNAGSYGILRILYTVYGPALLTRLGMGPILLTIACVTIILGSVWALREQHLKRRLAYSTISQMGYLLLGGALLSPLGLQATLVHFLNHGLLKIVLFFSVGILNREGITKIDEVQGKGKQYPLVFAAMTLSILGMVGIVPLNGFVSKWFYLQGALAANAYWVIATLGISSLLNALYFFPIISKAYFGKLVDQKPVTVQGGLAIPGIIIACSSLFLGIFPHWVVSMAERATTLLTAIQ